ncbi:hypothetical protein LTR28_002552 [Elasticomyces elasticus]|nr:hypothetical protein LTR28_002552 [Elasticomyces elasticus]
MEQMHSIPVMRAKVLTIMSTRAQDQDLVAQAADRMGIGADDARRDMNEWRENCIVPAFGWHPWFSHQMYDDDDPRYKGTTELSGEQKIEHYKSVLTPSPTEQSFLFALPQPQPFSRFLSQTRQYLYKYPVALVGEVGLDKQYRIPEAWLPGQQDERNHALTPGGREGRRLSSFRVQIDHQKKVLLAQLKLAGEMGRACSVHGVQAHGILFETLSQTWKGHEKKPSSKRERKKAGSSIQQQPTDGRGDGFSAEEKVPVTKQAIEVERRPLPYPPRICLHSFSGSPDTVKQYLHPSIPPDIFFSFSSVINFSHPGAGKAEEAIRAVPGGQILVESDLHQAGDRMDGYLEETIRKICEVKKWDLEDGVRMLGGNWKRFVFGGVNGRA